MIKVSVILPVYNVEKYLKKCLNSLTSQTLQDIEIICINDGSTDNSLAILESYKKKDKRIKIITQENKGLSGARNTGMNYVNGEYISFIDSDDWIELDALEKQYKYSKKLDLDLCIFSYKIFYEEDNSFEENDFTLLNKINPTLDSSIFNYNDILDVLFEIPHNTWNKLFKTSFIENMKFIEGKYYEDVDFHYNLIFKASKIGILRQPFYNYRIRSKSITTSGDAGSFDIFDVLKNVENNVKKAGIYNTVQQDFFKFLIVNFKFVFNRLDNKYKNMFFKTLKIYYDEFQLYKVDDSINTWHFDDKVFYQAINQSTTGIKFEKKYKKLYNDFLNNRGSDSLIAKFRRIYNDLFN